MKAARLIVPLLTVLTLLAPAARAQVTDEQVQAKIKQIVERLYALQNEQGTWDPMMPASGPKPDHVFGVNWGGSTALATYALLTAGESYQSPRLKRAIAFLASDDTIMHGVYGVGLRNHVWSHLPPSFEPQLRRDTQWLLDAQAGGPEKGGYHYTAKAPSFDNSVTQYGVLGVWEGAKRDMPIHTQYWDLVRKHFLATQNPPLGGWSYGAVPSKDHPVNGSMTASGLACLFIVQDYLFSQDFRKVGQTSKHPLTERINQGLSWFDKNFSALGNPPTKGGVEPYYLVGVERIGLASGYKQFAGKDWYAEGADVLVKSNFADVVNLSFSVIFLVRGRVPVFANKLRIPGYEWNNRPRDLARLAQWVSDEIEKEMNWQIVDISGKPEEWLDAPILYIAGHQKLELPPEQEQKIKRFIDLGGMVITTADDGEQAFTKSVLEMYERLYPQYKPEKLTAKDDLMGMVFPLKADKLGVMSVHNGVRHLALHIPRDVSWTLHSTSHADDFAWQFLTNTYFYATEKGNARPRLSEHYAARSDKGGGPKVEVARVQYEGNWDPTPLAWEVQSNAMFNGQKADVTVKAVDLKDLPASGVRFAHVTGTAAVKFSEEQIAAIQGFVKGGGVILFENSGGRGDFTQDVIPMLVAAFPGTPMRPLGLQSPVVTGEGFNGHNFAKAEYRSYTVLRSGRIRGPRLQAISIDGQPRVFVSNEDLSVGMIDQPVWGVYGYNAASARQIVTNLVLWAQASPAVAPAAAPPATTPAVPAAAPQ